jgi:hypothetical protein
MLPSLVFDGGPKAAGGRRPILGTAIGSKRDPCVFTALSEEAAVQAVTKLRGETNGAFARPSPQPLSSSSSSNPEFRVDLLPRFCVFAFARSPKRAQGRNGQSAFTATRLQKTNGRVYARAERAGAYSRSPILLVSHGNRGLCCVSRAESNSLSLHHSVRNARSLVGRCLFASPISPFGWGFRPFPACN